VIITNSQCAAILYHLTTRQNCKIRQIYIAKSPSLSKTTSIISSMLLSYLDFTHLNTKTVKKACPYTKNNKLIRLILPCSSSVPIFEKNSQRSIRKQKRMKLPLKYSLTVSKRWRLSIKKKRILFREAKIVAQI
jgi:hypothetical protein